MTEPQACLNCDEPLATPRPRYCPACGQETNIKPPTLREFAQQFGGAYIAAEGALWQSLKLLLLKPGQLTREYLDGRRRRYVLPLRLYLTISVIVLLALRWFGAAEVNSSLDEPAQEARGTMDISMFGGEAGMKDGVFFCRDLPGWVCARLEKRLDVAPAAQADMIGSFGQRFFANLGSAMFVLLPAFAGLLKIVYLPRRMRFTEHLVFTLHLHAFWFLMLGLLLTQVALLGVIAAIAVPGYALLAMRRVYGGRWPPLLARAALLAAAYALLLGGAILALGMVTLLF